MESSILYWAAAIPLIVLGMAGLVFPIVPGAPLLFAGLLLAAWADNFAYVGPWTLSLLGVLTLLTFVVDFFAGILGAKKFGASGRALWGAALGGLAGMFFGLPGIILGPFIGAVMGELSLRRSLGQAGLAGFGTTLGLVIGAAAKFALGFSMLGIFVISRFWGQA